ncbi:hypothetical protein NN561_002934 [Cricetulus griseus]
MRLSWGEVAAELGRVCIVAAELEPEQRGWAEWGCAREKPASCELSGEEGGKGSEFRFLNGGGVEQAGAARGPAGHTRSDVYKRQEIGRSYPESAAASRVQYPVPGGRRGWSHPTRAPRLPLQMRLSWGEVAAELGRVCIVAAELEPEQRGWAEWGCAREKPASCELSGEEGGKGSEFRFLNGGGVEQAGAARGPAGHTRSDVYKRQGHGGPRCSRLGPGASVSRRSPGRASLFYPPAVQEAELGAFPPLFPAQLTRGGILMDHFVYLCGVLINILCIEDTKLE